jgi:ketosteroid isomerase-like protein
MTQGPGDSGIVVATARPERALAMDLAREFMDALSHRDLLRAGNMLAADFVMTVSGGQVFRRLEDFMAHSALHYASVRKTGAVIEACEASNGIAVYLHGAMYGTWLNGSAFEARFCDRFLIRDGKLAELQTWSDAAEHARRSE